MAMCRYTVFTLVKHAFRRYGDNVLDIRETMCWISAGGSLENDEVAAFAMKL